MSEEIKILVVDDDQNIRKLIELYLKKEGYEVTTAHDGLEGFNLAKTEDFNLIILDIMLPKLNGWEVCEKLRKRSDVPIIMLTAKGEKYDKIKGLDLGADDYVTKPFDPDELIARVRARLRRTDSTDLQQVLEFPKLEINKTVYKVIVDGKELNLPPKEFDLLWYLATNRGQVFKREQLLDQVWGYNFIGDIRTVDTHVKRLRSKIDHEVEGISYLQTVWGVGYKFEVIEDADL
ncbi:MULTISPECIES: response regulator transcription factor [unclassified Candidatus Frackibacter]|uniref:response regulator transcription factor n=1 Tax=unclassified Candidatus Frackibacter TaxID=2648818 RepID=UPI0007983A9A|nr:MULTISPECIES: response regulator transcription factor [unclassified Candidatus Frackibacter]KXS41770.1 MAG: response regulator with CheY-like receiver domain and winged-helix DNA-binding domain [Candidatus Frackibacter sp. T328-2]SDC26782.1 two-component system, OmpR family, response regulator ResD [Candidatus Frackibacter sp. WG11]SEM53793.1 two-component system, OmpR family, response regulator ResD [Candidatus Frackibacter sp. WG12]SFL54683.1 two-component system, OmpR family, response reg